MRFFFICLSTFLIISTAGYAKIFKLKNGNTMYGRMVSSNQTMVLIEDERGNEIRVPYNEIDFQLLKQQEEQALKAREIEKAQEGVYKKQSVSVDLGSTIHYMFNYGMGTGITYEFALNSSLAISIRLYGAAIAVYFMGLNSYFNIMNVVPGIEFKWYPFNLAPRDLWISGVLQASFLSSSTYNGITYAPGQFDFLSSLNIGYKIVFAKEAGFFIEPLVGIGYSIGSFNGSYYDYGQRGSTGSPFGGIHSGLFYDYGLRTGLTF